MGSEGRRDRNYLAAKREFQTGQYPCRFGCGRPGTTVDHDPPLSTFGHWTEWTGRYLPACQTCQARQGQAITTRKRYRQRRWNY
jgi:hypothetical protein